MRWSVICIAQSEWKTFPFSPRHSAGEWTSLASRHEICKSKGHHFTSTEKKKVDTYLHACVLFSARPWDWRRPESINTSAYPSSRRVHQQKWKEEEEARCDDFDSNWEWRPLTKEKTHGQIITMEKLMIKKNECFHDDVKRNADESLSNHSLSNNDAPSWLNISLMGKKMFPLRNQGSNFHRESNHPCSKKKRPKPYCSIYVGLVDPSTMCGEQRREHLLVGWCVEER